MTKNKMEAVPFIEQYEPLIHKTLNRLNMTKSHMDYDDFYQEFQIHLLKLKDKFRPDEEVSEEEKQAMFIAYATKGLYWKGLDMIRMNQAKEFDSGVEDEDFDWFHQRDPSNPSEIKGSIYLEDFFAQAKKRLSEEDYLLLLYLASDDYSMKDIAKLMHVSPPVIYERRRRIQERLADIKNCLKD